MLGLTRSCLRSRSGCVSAFSPATAFARSGCVLRQLAQALRPAASAANTRTYYAAAEVLGQLVQALRPAASAANTRTYSAAAEITVREALNSALDEEISADPSVFLMGEEVGKYQGAYKISKDLLKSFR